MQSKMILAVCAMLFTMCVLWTMAVPKPRPRGATGSAPAPAAAAVAAPAAPRNPRGEFVEGVWCPAGFGLRLSAPAEWRPARSRGQARLARDVDPLNGQFELSARAVVGGEDLGARAEALQAVLSAQAGFELLSAGAADIGAREARRLEWRARGTNGAVVRATALQWISGPQEMLLVFSAAEARWSEVEGVAAAGLASLELGPKAPTHP